MGFEEEKFRDFALAFLKEAKEDLDSAEILLENRKYSRAVYHCQQCSEKAVKALFEMERIFIAEHDLSAFFVKLIYNNKEYTEYKKEADSILEILDYFEGEASRTRYPKKKDNKVVTPSEEYLEEDALHAIDKAQEMLNIIREVLKKRFNIEVL